MSSSNNTRPFSVDFPDGWDGDGPFPLKRLPRPRIVAETIRRDRRRARYAARAAIRRGDWDTLTTDPRPSWHFPCCVTDIRA